MFAFCSTSRIAVPPALIFFITSKIVSTTLGAIRVTVHQRSSSLGELIIARPIASICCSPPLSVPPSCARRSTASGKTANTESSSSFIFFLRRTRERAHFEFPKPSVRKIRRPFRREPETPSRHDRVRRTCG